ncbi:MAG: acyl carrier protein [Candidatus Vogelbacteria bacterium]
MTRPQVKEKLIEIVVDQGLSSETELPDHTRFTEDLNADSIDSFELVIEIQNAFDIKIPDDDVSKLKTVGDTVDCIFNILVKKRG